MPADCQTVPDARRPCALTGRVHADLIDFPGGTQPVTLVTVSD
jgi:hypothetical protein